MAIADAELSLSLQFADPSVRPLLPRSRVRRWLRACLDHPAEITLRLVGADEGRRLNREFRRKDYPTNVLTFDYASEPVVVADLVLCVPVVAAEAEAQGKTLHDHLAHLIVHGGLHAQGWDHERVADARRMEARESELMQSLGLPDPWA